MRRSSTRKGQTNSAASNNSSAVDLFRSASGKAATKELERIDNLFYAYANNSSVMIECGFHVPLNLRFDESDPWKHGYGYEYGTGTNAGTPIRQNSKKVRCGKKKKGPGVPMPYLNEPNVPDPLLPYPVRVPPYRYAYSHPFSNIFLNRPEGIEALCSDLEVDHTDVRILMLAWKMQAEKQGYFTLEEWRRALKALRADAVTKLKKALPELEKEVKRPSNFVDFYSYAFRYCLTEEKQKSIDIESICQLLDLVLGSQFRAQVDYFVEYLRTQIDYKVINMDQWMGFYRFCNEISFPDHSNYDAELAWPLILDNFVEWMRAKQR
ncbi:hypothetical protein HYC85_027759 [Camellia sinensis]|uniref:Defective in cullin neddylation protein n=1 Tax=Camellia sinensis TaxID=4442 RepID=A0A7J7FV96_CAMSI|nr:hypothetical protein HYC85_027759 [Camellia sinensis]